MTNERQDSSGQSDMPKGITSVTFNNDNPIDQELLGLANELCSLPENCGIPRTSVLRNFIVRKLRVALDAARRTSALSSIGQLGGQG